MQPPADVTPRELLRYVKLEEDEDTADLLRMASFLYVGTAEVNGELRHFWSYPNVDAVRWVSWSERSLHTEWEVPPAIQAATRPRDEHPAKKVPKPLPPPDRTPVPAPVWIPYKDMPALFTLTAWAAPVSIEHAARVFGAKPHKENVGYPILTFLIKLTSGRYAWLTADARNPTPVTIDLERFSDERSRQGEDFVYFIHISDLFEVLGALGVDYEAPTTPPYFDWR